MEISLQHYRHATGGRTRVPDNWMTATGPRTLIGVHADPFQLWCKYHGAEHGFEEDSTDYSFLEFISKKGVEFEQAWMDHYAPNAVRAMQDDRDVSQVGSFLKTVQLILTDTNVVSHAALWGGNEAKVYGSADCLVRESWLYSKFPHLRPDDFDPTNETYVVIDQKFTTGLQEPKKRHDFEIYKVQLTVYSWCLSQLIGKPIPFAYLATRDLHDKLLRVEVDCRPNTPLPAYILELRDQFLDIKLNGARYLPWRDEIVAPNFACDHHAPWHGAKKQIAFDHVPIGPLAWLPRIGETQVEILNRLGYQNLADVIEADEDAIPWESMHGIGKVTGKQIRAILTAQRTGKPSQVPKDRVPDRVPHEYYVDFEYLSNINCDFSQPWPGCLEGKEQVFMIGLGWEERGKWSYKQFTAASETKEAERKMFKEFLKFLDERRALNNANTRLYHWTNAEVRQCIKSAIKHKLPQLAHLPWYDLQRCALAVPLGLPGAYSYGLKAVAKAVGEISEEHKIAWSSELCDGLSASVMGWAMLASDQPLDTPEFKTLSAYLEIDCKSMWQVLRWLRSVAKEDDHARENSAHVDQHSESRGWWRHARLMVRYDLDNVASIRNVIAD